MGSLLLPGALILYIIGVFLAVLGTFYQSVGARRTSPTVLLAASALHLGAFMRQWLAAGHLPLTHVGEYLLGFGLVVMLMHYVVWMRWRVEVLALILPPVAMISGFFALGLLHAADPGDPDVRKPWFLFHTASATVGMAILCVAFAMSLIYLIKDRALKSNRALKLLAPLPPLDRTDRIGVYALGLGFFLLTLGIVTGVALQGLSEGRWWLTDPKQTFPFLAWIVFAVILALRAILGFRGRKAAYWTITGFMLGLLTVLGMSV